MTRDSPQYFYERIADRSVTSRAGSSPGFAARDAPDELALYGPAATPQGALSTGIVATTFWLAVSITDTLFDTPLAT